MHVEVRKPVALGDAEIAAWLQIIGNSCEYTSPYFHPGFTLDVACVRDDVEVAVFYQGDEIVGFFPFQRSGQAAKPVGGMLSDAHGVIVRDGIDVDWPEIIEMCGLVSWDYHYKISSQIPDPRWQPTVEPAAVMNVSGGFDEYSKRLESRSVIKQSDRKSRKLARECGELRFEWDSCDEDAFELMLMWKSQQYHDSNIADVFSFGWTEALLRRIWKQSGHSYEGLLSVLYVDDKPAAVHFGVRAGRVLHQWFPAYDPELQCYSPGIVHLLDMARHANDNGVHRIDLGRVCHYKRRVATHCVDVAEGSIDIRPFAHMLKTGYRQTFEWLRHSPLRTVARIPGRMLRRMAEQKQFD